jgi:hypothetical protein
MNHQNSILGTMLSLALFLGCASSPPPPPAENPGAMSPEATGAESLAGAEAVAGPEGTEGPPAEAAVEPEASASEPPPECSVAADCASKGKAKKGMQWACSVGVCSQEKAAKKRTTKK